MDRVTGAAIHGGLLRGRALAVVAASACLVLLSPRAQTADMQPDHVWQVAGLSAPADILVDEWGVPHLYAADHYDAFFVQGFNAARDRLWQIDLWRRRGLGQLAAVFGPEFVSQDRAARLFLYRGSMFREWLAYGSDAKRIASAFAAGINAFVELTAQQPELLPPEFTLLGYQPARWQPEDVVRIRSHGLWRNVASEVARAQMTCRAGLASDRMRQRLEPPWETSPPAGLDACAVPADVLDTYSLATAPVRFDGDRPLAAMPLTAPQQVAATRFAGSNNWVVAPARTASGRPVLANDPHRGHAVPSLRYAVHLSAPGLNVIGAGEPALPGISIGHNDRIAFGLTIFAIDQEDLYVYARRSPQSFEYRYGDAWENTRSVTETVEVAGAPNTEVSLQFTRHGPLVYANDTHLFAVRAAWLEPGMAPYFGSIEYMRADNWNQFVGALNRWGAPAENQVYADVDGNIGYKPAGLAPRRHSFDGLLPVPGDGRYEWHDYLDMDTLPVEFNPPRGWAATANSMTLPADYPIDRYRLGFEWTAPWRYQRIAAVLDSQAQHTFADSLALQRDNTSMLAHAVIALLPAAASTGAGSTEANMLAELRRWDGVLGPDSRAAALWVVWFFRHLAPAVLHATLPDPAARALAGSGDTLEILAWLQTAAAARQLMLTTLSAAAAELGATVATDLPRWGALHQMRYVHPLAARADASLAAHMYIPPLPVGGSGYTPNNTSFDADSFDVRGGASWRMVLDVGNWDAARMTNTPGQSGDPRSPRYADLAPSWAAGDSHPLLFSRAAVERHTVLRLRLLPRDTP